MKPVRCVVRVFDGTSFWFSADAPHQALALRRSGAYVEDLRLAPPYPVLLPCPYCGVDGGEHVPLKHVDPTKGVPT